MTRRDLALSLLATAMAQDDDSGARHSRVFVFDQLPVKPSATGASRPVMRGKLPTGESVEIHETTLLPGQSPHPPHHHTHCEFMFIREGTVEFTFGGTTARLREGGIAYAASDEMHGLKNVGSEPANYFVIAIGLQPKPA